MGELLVEEGAGRVATCDNQRPLALDIARNENSYADVSAFLSRREYSVDETTDDIYDIKSQAEDGNNYGES